jgi:hypothetical protein
MGSARSLLGSKSLSTFQWLLPIFREGSTRYGFPWPSAEFTISCWPSLAYLISCWPSSVFLISCWPLLAFLISRGHSSAFLSSLLRFVLGPLCCPFSQVVLGLGCWHGLVLFTKWDSRFFYLCRKARCQKGTGAWNGANGYHGGLRLSLSWPGPLAPKTFSLIVRRRWI